MLKFRIVLVLTALATTGAAQVLTLKQAVQTALTNYPIIKAKGHYVQASQAGVKEARRESLPDFVVSAQQDYGTVNGQNGPLFSYTGGAVASSGPVLPGQNGAAAFGALYLANINWNFFAFGRYKEKVAVAKKINEEDTADLYQERFQDEVQVAGAYLNLLAAQQLIKTERSNLARAETVQRVVLARVKGQLNPGVDSSQANADVSSAKIQLTNAIDLEQQRASELAQVMGVPAQEFTLDTLFLYQIPATLAAPSGLNPREHPLLKYFQSRVNLSQEETNYLRTYNYPVFSLFGVTQGRGSGFDAAYGPTNPYDYTHSYTQGVGIQRLNYLIGVGVTWNLTNPLRVHEQVAEQRFTTLGLGDEYDLIDQRLTAQRTLAETRITNALSNYREAPVQVKAAQDAYMQKSVLYKNGLTNIVDLEQTMYVLNRAENDRDIAYNNVWQALLYKAAATGDWDLFINAF